MGCAIDQFYLTLTFTKITINFIIKGSKGSLPSSSGSYWGKKLIHCSSSVLCPFLLDLKFVNIFLSLLTPILAGKLDMKELSGNSPLTCVDILAGAPNTVCLHAAVQGEST